MTHFPSLDDKLHQNGSMAALFASKSSRPSTMHHGWCSINIYCRKELMNENHENIGTLKKTTNSFVGQEVQSMLLIEFMCLGGLFVTQQVTFLLFVSSLFGLQI